MQIFKRAVVSLAVCASLFGASLSAHALNVPAGGNDILSFNESLAVGAFNKSYSFTLGSGGFFDIDGSINTSRFITGLTYNLTGPSGVLVAGTGPGLFSLSGVGAGAYSFNVAGSSTRSPGGIYSGFAIITSAVPEPATLALSLAALGLVGGLALRRRTL